jgi:hypothetical protein
VSDQTSEVPRPVDAPTSPDITLPLPARPAALRPGQVALAFIAIAAASFLLGIAVATSGGRSSGERTVAESDVGPSGGTIRFDGGQLVFPQGAVSRTIHVVVSTSRVDERLRVEAEEQPIIVERGELVAYTFEPRDVTFREPVEITFRLPEDARNGTVFARRGDAIVLLTGTVDPERATATVRVTDFSF